MDTERLQHLRRQKALLLEHLDWISQEIDRETHGGAPRPRSAPSQPPSNRFALPFPDDRPVAESLDLESSPPDVVASDLYSELGPDTKSAAAETKRGCLLLGALAFASFAAVCGYVLLYY